jgi:transcriptional regulator PpsR
LKSFEAPDRTLGGLDAESASAVISAAADVALVIDSDGVIRDVAFGSDDLSREGYADWLGHPWIDTVTVESRPKIEALLRDATANVPTRGRHVNHTSALGTDVPVLYSAVRVGPRQDRIVALGRDLRGMAALQQRLVMAQQSLERDYWRLRQVETRYRLLFQMAVEAVLVVDAATERIVESNPAADRLVGERAGALSGRPFASVLAEESRAAARAMLSAALGDGRAEDVRLRIASPPREYAVSAKHFRQEKGDYFLVRFALPAGEPADVALPRARAALLHAVESAPDAYVVTDGAGRVIAANPAFAEVAQLVDESQARGELLDQWLGRAGVDLEVLLSNLRQHGSIHLFSTTLRGAQGANADVEISAARVPGADPSIYGFAIRNVGRRLSGDVGTAPPMARTPQQLSELVGRMPMKDIVRDATDMIEKMCIEAALELTRDNRASAAEMLGLSRQSLYMKLRRYGLGDLAGSEEK